MTTDQSSAWSNVWSSVWHAHGSAWACSHLWIQQPRHAHSKQWACHTRPTLLPPPPHRPRAFTLIELLAVIVILGIAGALVIPAMGETGILKVQGAVRTIVADITFAQSEAVGFQERRALVFDVPNSSYRLVEVPGDVVDPETNTAYDPTRPGGLYVVDFINTRFGDSRITSADFDGNNTLIFDAMGGPVSDPSGNTPSNGGSITVTGSGSVFTIAVAPFTGHVTISQAPAP